MKKSILALLLAVLMVASLLPAAALADGPAENYVAAYTNGSGTTTYYTTVGAAISASNAGGGGTVTLLKNAELKAADADTGDQVTDNKHGYGVAVRKNLTLDLGEHTLNCDEFFGIAIYWVNFTIKNGTYKNTCPGGTAIEAGKTSTVTIANGTTIIAACDALVCDGRNTANVYGNIVSGRNGVFGLGPFNKITIDGAEIVSGAYAVKQDPYHKTQSKDEAGSTYIIKNSDISTTDPSYDAIYMANYKGVASSDHTLNISDSVITGGNGVSISCTKATISGAKTEIISTNEAGNSVLVSFMDNDGTSGSLTINDGTFKGQISETYSTENNAVIIVNDGNFDTSVAKYLSTGLNFELNKNGVYTYYSTFDEAFTAAERGSIITDLERGEALTVFAVTVDPNNGQAATTRLVLENGVFFLPAAPTRDGYAFLGWSDGDKTYSPWYEYTVTRDTIITALWKEEYNVVYIYNNGAATGHVTVLKGESVTLPTPSKSGYAFLGWTCSDGNVYDGGDSVVIWGNTTFEASWVRHPDTPYVPEPSEPVEPDVPSFPFYDVPTSAWYYTAVKYVYDNKLMDGVDTYTFAPNATLTRAMVWTIIARMSGVDTTGGNTWYAKAQEWVVVNGISDGENPTAAITRQELVTMLYRYAQIKGYDVSVGENTNILSYVDATSISDYAVAAFQWACGSGLTEGDENGALTPLATATRAQAAAMIMRFCESVK